MATRMPELDPNASIDPGPAYTPGASAGSSGFNPSFIDDNGQYGYNGESQNPSLSVGGYGSEADAQAAWFAANPQYAQFQSDPNVAANGGASGPNLTGLGGNAPGGGAAGGASSFTPTGAQIAGLAPPPLQAFGNIPQVSPTYATAPNTPGAAQVSPTYASAATVDPNQNLQYLQQYEGLEQQALAPQFQRQQQQLGDSLASRGITNSGAAEYLTNDLRSQQDATLAGAIAPFVSQEAGYTQQDISQNQGNRQQVGLTNAAASNAASGANAAAVNALTSQGYSYQEAVALANQQAANGATSTNAGYYDQALTGDAASYDQYLNTLLGYGANIYGGEQSAYLNSFGPNTGVLGTINTGEQGSLNTFGNVYGAATSGQGSMFGGLGQGFGSYEAALAGRP